LAAVVTLAPADCSDDCSDCPKLLKSNPAISRAPQRSIENRSTIAASVPRRVVQCPEHVRSVSSVAAADSSSTPRGRRLGGVAFHVREVL